MREPGAGRPGPGPGVLLAAAAAFALAAWLAGRESGGLWSGELLILAAVAFGALAHAGARRHRPGDGLMAWLEGSAGHYLLFVGAGLFLAAEAYAVGLAAGSAAPGVALLAMLLPPAAAAGYALRRAEAGDDGERGRDGNRRDGEARSGGRGDGDDANGAAEHG